VIAGWGWLPAPGAVGEPEMAIFEGKITVCGRKCLNFEHLRPQTVIMNASSLDPTTPSTAT
jgi:hypothetical protein